MLPAIYPAGHDNVMVVGACWHVREATWFDRSLSKFLGVLKTAFRSDISLSVVEILKSEEGRSGLPAARRLPR